jgi:hypothetical protein
MVPFSYASGKCRNNPMFFSLTSWAVFGKTPVEEGVGSGSYP